MIFKGLSARCSAFQAKFSFSVLVPSHHQAADKVSDYIVEHLEVKEPDEYLREVGRDQKTRAKSE